MNKDYFADKAKYISANSASLKTGYAQDHIGALIRTGKVEGKKIGRSWFVDLESLKEHKKNRKLKSEEKKILVEETKPFVYVASPLKSGISYFRDPSPKLPELSKTKYRIKRELLFRELFTGVLATSVLILLITTSSVLGLKQLSKNNGFGELANSLISGGLKDGLNNTSASILGSIQGGAQRIFDNLTSNKSNQTPRATELVLTPSLFDQNICSPFTTPALAQAPTQPQPSREPRAITIEYKSLSNIPPLKYTLADIVKNGNTTTDDIRLLGSVEIGKNLRIRGGIETNSSIIAKGGSFLSLGVNGDFSASGKISLGNPKDTLTLKSKNITVDSDGNAYFAGTIQAPTASSTNLFVSNANFGSIISGVINGQTVSSTTNFTGTITATSGLATLSNLLLTSSSTLQNFTFINATGTSATTTNFAANTICLTSDTCRTTWPIGNIYSANYPVTLSGLAFGLVQAQASHENYALFTLNSMLSNLVHINKVLDSTMILCKEIEYTIDQVKIKQRERILRDNLEKKEGKLNEIK